MRSRDGTTRDLICPSRGPVYHRGPSVSGQNYSGKRKELTGQMFKKTIPLSDVLRMTDLMKDVSIDKYSQEEYRQVLNEIMYISITDYDSEEVQNEHLFSPS